MGLIGGLIGLIGGLIGLIGGLIHLIGGLIGLIGGQIGLIGGLMGLIGGIISIMGGLNRQAICHECMDIIRVKYLFFWVNVCSEQTVFAENSVFLPYFTVF